MRTLIIISPGFPANEQDSTCLPAIQQFVVAMSKQRSDLKVVVVAIQYPFKTGRYLWNGVEVLAAGGANAGGLRRLLTWARTYRLLKKARNNNCEGILSLWLHESALLGKWFAKANGLKHFIWLQGQDAKKNNSYVKRIGPVAQELIAISEFNSAELTRNHNIKPAYIIPNGINPDLFPELNTGTRSISILGVGSLIALKRWDLFIDVVSELTGPFPGIKCVIIGDGPERSSLESQIRQRGQNRRVALYGSLAHEEVLRMMNESIILFHPSEYEGYSTVMLEGLYSGCKVVCAFPPGSDQPENLYVCATPLEMKDQLQQLLQEQKPAERVLVHTIEESAKKMLGLFKAN